MDEFVPPGFDVPRRLETTLFVLVPLGPDGCPRGGGYPPRSGLVTEPVGLPLRHEEEAEGLVASVFLDIRRRMPFVPALFKALASDPEALLAGWLQARALYDDPAAADAADALRRAALPSPGLVPTPTPELAETVRPFVEELPFMLLIVSSISLTLDGAIVLQALPEAGLPSPGPVPPPEFPDRGEHPLFAEICRVYGTRHLPSIYRTLATRGLLEESWRAIGPFLERDAGRALVERLGSDAERAAAAFPDYAFFGVERARPVIEQFRQALPRNLVFAAAAASGRP